MTVSDAQKKANKKYFDNNYKQVKLSMPIKEAEELEEHCKRFQYTKAGFIRDAIKEKIEKDISNNMRWTGCIVYGLCFFIVKYIGTIIYSAQLKSDIFVKKANWKYISTNI